MIDVSSTDNVHIVGDSITDPYAWYAFPGGFKARLQGPYPSRGPGSVSANVGRRVSVTAYGVNGSLLSAAVAALSVRVLPYSPSVLIWEFGTNDVNNSISASTFLSTLSTGISTVQASFPTCRHMLIGVGAFGELWTNATPPAFSGNTTATVSDATIDAFNSGVSAGLGAMPAAVEYVNIRARAARYQKARGASAPGVAVSSLTLDGVHPTRNYGLLMADAVMAHINLVP